MAHVHVHPEDAGPADDAICRESSSPCPAVDSVSREQESFSSATTAVWRPGAGYMAQREITSTRGDS